nr:MAG TPA: hypothetical protein [Caudoviricetes sp.]
MIPNCMSNYISNYVFTNETSKFPRPLPYPFLPQTSPLFRTHLTPD